MADKHTSEMYTSHRARMRRRIAERGAGSLENYQLIEMALYDVRRRVDTYPVAHRLLDRFGTIDGVFTATREELLEVYGVGPASADRILMIGDIVERSVAERLTVAPLDSEMRAMPLLFWLMRRNKTDSTLAVILGKDRKYIIHRLFAPKEETEGFPSFLADSAALGGKFCIFAHRHPNGAPDPTPDDLRVTENVAELCREAGIELDEHYIISGSDAYPIIASSARESKRNDTR